MPLVRTTGWLFVVPFLLAMGAPEQRYRRPIEGAAGWTEVELPDDVFDAARPGLSDLRVLAAADEEIPYALSGNRAPSPTRIPLFDVEQSTEETTAIADRGAGAPRADSVELEVAEAEFIKPVTLEASADRATWSQIGRGSIFATGSGVRMTRLHFAPSDRRYWRFRFDDRNGPAVKVDQVVVGLSPVREAPPRVVPVRLEPQPDAAPLTSTYRAVLPSAKLPLSALRVHATDAAFVRRVRVFEQVWFRDEVSRRLLGEADIARTAGGAEQASIPLSEPTSQHIEIDVDRAGGVPLHGVTAEIVVASRTVRFHAPEGSALTLAYGANTGTAPAYDLAAALQQGSPAAFTKAKLGAVSDTGAGAPALPAVLRGSVIERKKWKTEQLIVLPAQGSIAYLDIERVAGSLADVRIVDRQERQVPYIVEAEPRHARLPLTHRVERVGGETLVHLGGLEDAKAVETIELEIASPDYFTRRASVVEQTFDARGETHPRPVGETQLVKTADQAAVSFRIGVGSLTGPHVAIHIADGDNAPLVVKSVAAEVTRRRVNFVFGVGDELRLLSGNDAVSPPAYDLTLVAERVLASSADAATLGEAQRIVVGHPPAPAWFWIFVLAAAVILLIALARTLTQTPVKPGSEGPR